MKRHRAAIFLKVVLIAALAIAGFGQAVHYLWNWLIPSIFDLPAITFWQSVGLLVLSWLLFGGWRGLRGQGTGFGSHGRRRLMERWEQMTPEEREKFRTGLQGRCDWPRAR